MASSNKNKKTPTSNSNQLTGFNNAVTDTTDSSTGVSSSDDDEKRHKLRQTRNKSAAKVMPTNTDQMEDARIHDPSPVALLDMLAEVASATLKNDPVLAQPPAKRRRSSPLPACNSPIRRTPCNSDLLSLDQIRMLSDRLLLNMFSEQTADELRKTYTFTCYLIPEKCQQKYSSFGNEHKARLLMKSHLLAHIAELLVEDSHPDLSPDRKFTAETLNARKKRLAAFQGSRRKVLRKNSKAMRAKRLMAQGKEKQTKKVVCSSKTQVTIAESGQFTRILPFPEEQQNGETSDNKNAVGVGKRQQHTDHSTNGSIKPLSGKTTVKPSRDRPSKRFNKASSLSKESSSISSGRKPRPRKKKRVHETSEASTETKRASDDEEAEVILKGTSNPLIDHSYTYLTGKRIDLDHWELVFSDEDEETASESVVYMCPVIDEGSVCVSSDHYSRIVMSECSSSTFPHLNALSDPLVGQMYEIQTECSESNPSSNSASRKNNNNNNVQTSTVKEAELLDGVVMQAKPKRIRRINKIVVPEEFASESSDTSDEDEAVGDSDESDKLPRTKADSSKSTSSKLPPKEGTPEWERKLALKCIRMLRAKKKDERVTLVCKICQDKIFTAQATLMYHYRSHAGIKPFVCNICNTTFTRQHSLNYHMLIHNNKSRFTCVECGRKFRHPSHFKEHMRRHTGETPFECADCGLRFKTRNTYKRHLKTRHGKLLTANGIVILTSEEFLRVKTNPRKKATVQRKDKETQWPETENKSSESMQPPKSDKVTVKYCNELKLDPTIVQKHFKKSP